MTDAQRTPGPWEHETGPGLGWRYHVVTSPERAKPATHSNRTHEQCDECALVDVEPQACDGHPQGPTACHQFTSLKDTDETS